MMDRDAKRRWALFEQWENEYLAEQLPRRTHADSLRSADEMYQLADTLAHEVLHARPVKGDDLLESDHIQALLRMRRVFDAHARQSR